MATHKVVRVSSVGEEAAARLIAYVEGCGLWASEYDGWIEAGNRASERVAAAAAAALDEGATCPAIGAWSKTSAGWGVAVDTAAGPVVGDLVVVESRAGARKLVRLTSQVRQARINGRDVGVFDADEVVLATSEPVEGPPAAVDVDRSVTTAGGRPAVRLCRCDARDTDNRGICYACGGYVPGDDVGGFFAGTIR